MLTQQPALCHSWLSHGSATSIQLLTNAPGRQEMAQVLEVSATHVGDLDGAPSSGCCGHLASEPVDGRRGVCVCGSAFQIN